MLDFSFAELYAFILALVSMMYANRAKVEKCHHCDGCEQKSTKKGHPQSKR